MEQPTRPARKVAIADHIWDAFDDMAREMGSDRDALINQAMYMFARLNGFLEGGGRTTRNEAVVVRPSSRAPVQVLPPVDRSPQGPTPKDIAGTDEVSPRREVEPIPTEERKADAAGEPERPSQEKDGAAGRATSARQELLGDDQADGAFQPREERGDEPEVSASPVVTSGSGLYLITESGDERVSKERFVIGRGKHCDLVINSGKVSREHASIVQDGDDWYIEDLGSSNGTWYNKQRIKRRKIEDGDEYFVCSERIRFALR